MREYLLEIRFDEANTPRKCWQYSRTGLAEDRSELQLDNAGGVHAVALDLGIE